MEKTGLWVSKGGIMGLLCLSFLLARFALNLPSPQLSGSQRNASLSTLEDSVMDHLNQEDGTSWAASMCMVQMCAGNEFNTQV